MQNAEYVLVDLNTKQVSKSTHTLHSTNELSDLFESLDAANALVKEIVVATPTPKTHNKTVLVLFKGVSARVPMVPEEQASPRVKEILKLSKTNLTDGVKEEQKRGSQMPSKTLVAAGLGATALMALYKLKRNMAKKVHNEYLF